MIHVMAIIQFQPQHLGEVKKAMHVLAKNSRGETGCVRYEVFQRGDESVLVTQETWADKSAETAHLTGPHVAAAFANIGGFLTAAPDIQYYTQWV